MPKASPPPKAAAGVAPKAGVRPSTSPPPKAAAGVAPNVGVRPSTSPPPSRRTPKKKPAVTPKGAQRSDVPQQVAPAPAPMTAAVPQKGTRKVELVVEVPAASVGEHVIEVRKLPQRVASFVAPRVYRDADVDEAPTQGWLSGPCGCFLSIWATLGDMVEGGAEQFVGLMLLAISGAITYVLSGKLWAPPAAAGGAGGEAPPSPPTAVSELMERSNGYALRHPATFVGALLGGLCAIALLVLFEEEMRRALAAWRMSQSGYAQLETAETPAAGSRVHPSSEGDGGARTIQRAVRFMRERTLRQELHRAVEAAETLDLQLRVASRGEQRSEGDERGEGVAGVAGAAGEQHIERERTKRELAAQQERRASLRMALATAAAASTPDLLKGRSNSRWQPRGCVARCTGSAWMAVFRRTHAPHTNPKAGPLVAGVWWVRSGCVVRA
jgi:hypothetical protein